MEVISIHFQEKREKHLSQNSENKTGTVPDDDINNFEKSDIKFQIQQTSSDTYLKANKLKSKLIFRHI